MAIGIGLSALHAASEAIDATSNNIANAQTIGYKAGQYVFQDEFFRATDPQNPNRTGMGTAITQIRRPQTNGSIVATSNPLDLAIGGIGMFTTAKTVVDGTNTGNPSDFQYTRNGQFGVDNQNRIVNENGNYLVGYPANPDGTINDAVSSVLKLDQAPLPGTQTQNSKIDLNIDDSTNPIHSQFDPTNSGTYTQSTSQTIYDSTGLSHTLSLYYVKQDSIPLVFTDGGNGTFNYLPKQNSVTTGTLDGSGNPTTTTITGQLATTANPATANNAEETLSNASVKYVSGGPGVGATYLMTLQDGSTLTVTMSQPAVSAGSHDPVTGNLATTDIPAQYTIPTSRFAVFATIDGVAVPGGGSPSTAADFGASTGYPTGVSGPFSGQTALGTMAFVGGKNIDSLARGVYNSPQFKSSFKIAANVGETNKNQVAFNIDSTDMTAYSAVAQTYTNSQDGSPLSQLSSYSFDSTGKLVAVYSNGQSKIQGQVKLANFTNDEGLIPIGGNSFEESALSGQPSYGTAGAGLFGALKSQALEQSNVDLTSQLVTLMSLQRQYSAASQVVKTSQTIEDDVLNKLG
jgi:flagellar hook protein FlgE